MRSALSNLRRWPVIAVALLALGIATAASLAAVGGSSTIYACVKRKGGAVRIVARTSRCKKSERKLSWNTTGPAGASGPRGRTGSRGPSGAAGASGSPGNNGAARGFVDANPPTSGEYVHLPGSGSPFVVATLNLPTGSYVIQGDIHLLSTVAAGTSVTCRLQAGGQTLDEDIIDVGTEKAGQIGHGDLALGGGLTIASAGAVVVSCTPVTGESAAAAAKITAVQVSALTSTTG